MNHVHIERDGFRNAPPPTQPTKRTKVGTRCATGVNSRPGMSTLPVEECGARVYTSLWLLSQLSHQKCVNETENLFAARYSTRGEVVF